MTDRDEWLEWRRGGIGASDVAGVLGISPWQSPWSVWADKSGLLPPQAENEYVTAGRWLEAAIGPWFTNDTGLHVAGEQTWCSHRDHDHHRCTVDGFVFESPPVNVLTVPVTLTDDDIAEIKRRFTEQSRRPPTLLLESPDPPEPTFDIDHALGLLEIKVTGPGRRWDEVPAHYQSQGQWQMHVTGLDRVWFAVLMGRRLDIHELERDQADIDFMAARVDEFWHDHVVAGIPPPVDGHDATLRALGAAYAEPVEGLEAEVEDGDVSVWLADKAATKEAKDREKAAAAAIEAALGKAEIGTVAGRRVVTWRQQTRKTTCKACGHVDESEPFRVLRPVKQKETA